MKYLLLLFICLNLTCCTQQELKPFVTDGCSMFPDKIVNKNWTHCCIEHDLAYYAGGTKKERLLADMRLKQCVQSESSEKLSNLVFLGVRLGGTVPKNVLKCEHLVFR